MVKQVAAEELQHIVSIIERYADAVGLDALFKAVFRPTDNIRYWNRQ
jgi:hypothetical protein